MSLLALIWGAGFVAMKFALSDTLSVGAMLTLRFAIGASVLYPLARFFKARFTRSSVRDGFVLGLWLTLLFWLQADGIRETTASKTGFITGLYVIFTPIVSLFYREKLKVAHGLGALAACLGLYMLVHEAGAPFGGWNRGDTKIFVGAIACGWHIVLTGRFAKRSDGWVLATVQVATVAVICLCVSLATGAFQGALKPLSQPGMWIALGYQGLLATAFAFWGMSTFQRYLGATEAAIICSMEPVYAALIAVSGWVPGIAERMTSSQAGGAALLLGAMILAEVGPKWLKARDTQDDVAEDTLSAEG